MPLILDQPGDADPPYCSSVFAGEERVGLVTSGVWSYTLNRCIALAYIAREHATPGCKLTVDVLGTRYNATVSSEPVFDPTNEKLRA